MIQIDRETFQMMLHQIMERFDRIDDRLNRMNRQTAALEGDKLLDNQYVRTPWRYETYPCTLPPEEARHILHD